MHFIVVPIGRHPDMGFWLQAATPEEARRLVSLNVPHMEDAIHTSFATCAEDHIHSPGYGVIVGGSGRTYTITRRSEHAHRS